ncbi:UNKNOWN [Stylonychia lemnae]|uniref:Uncharacterized protein n=1 Tax=Stylonychia lemnae TaxID=5949 RepID=A0A078A882_STYLE|nr:UNKNOWN [Stylonychia lemnae]|eukprot:CDW78076.1 UNKNOWN [Stylonychia lemnae]
MKRLSEAINFIEKEIRFENTVFSILDENQQRFKRFKNKDIVIASGFNFEHDFVIGSGFYLDKTGYKPEQQQIQNRVFAFIQVVKNLYNVREYLCNKYQFTDGTPFTNLLVQYLKLIYNSQEAQDAQKFAIYLMQHFDKSVYLQMDIFEALIQTINKEQKVTSQNRLLGAHLPKLDPWEIWFKENNNVGNAIFKKQNSANKLLMQPKKYHFNELLKLIKQKLELSPENDLVLVEMDKRMNVEHIFQAQKHPKITLKHNQKLQVYGYVIKTTQSPCPNFQLVKVVDHKGRVLMAPLNVPSMYKQTLYEAFRSVFSVIRKDLEKQAFRDINFNQNLGDDQAFQISFNTYERESLFKLKIVISESKEHIYDHYNDKNTILMGYKQIQIVFTNKNISREMRKYYKYLHQQIKNIKQLKPQIKQEPKNLNDLLAENFYKDKEQICQKCHLKKIISRVDMTHHPQYLIIGIERSIQKGEVIIDYLIQLNIPGLKITVDGVQYELISIVTEQGKDKRYFVYNRHLAKNEWYCYIDTLVYPVLYDKINTLNFTRYLVYKKVEQVGIAK